MRFVKKISERGTLTLPSDVRDALGVQDGDYVEFEVVRVHRKDCIDASTARSEPPETIAALAKPAASPLTRRSA